MSTLERNVVVSPEEYLEGELHSHIRHEYVAGRLYAITGASETHNLIAGNLYALLHQRLRGTPCRVFIAARRRGLGPGNLHPRRPAAAGVPGH